MTSNQQDQARWVKSTYSGDGGDCVELDMAHFGLVRDSKDPRGPRLRFTPEALTAFLTATASGAFHSKDLA
ncbi:DUF397 domain-containing protein [Kitasatospora sp. NPDC051984]|uniref:DUF397 domain-containing protein n=1 Tax=Kitasatospora sp. NPDC051984 TaxID=3364059 RepID=UPI0037C5C43B